MLCVFLYPHLRIKSKTCVYIRHLLQNVGWNLVDGKALDYRFYTQMWVESICFRMQSEIQQMVKLQTIDFIRKAGTKKTKHLPIECLYGTIIIYSVEGKWMQNDLELGIQLDCAEFGQGQIFDRNANAHCLETIYFVP